jgi:hypothetical protein
VIERIATLAVAGVKTALPAGVPPDLTLGDSYRIRIYEKDQPLFWPPRG